MSEPGTTAPRALRKLETVAVVLPPDGTEDVDLTGAPLMVLATLFGDTSPTVELSLDAVAFETGDSWPSVPVPLPPLANAVALAPPACLDDAWVVHPPGDALVAGGVSRVCGPNGRLEVAR